MTGNPFLHLRKIVIFLNYESTTVKMSKICEICSNSFIPDSNCQKYCKSEVCQRAVRNIYCKKQYHKNKDKVCKRLREQYDENKEKMREYKKMYQRGRVEESKAYFQNNKNKIMKRNIAYTKRVNAKAIEDSIEKGIYKTRWGIVEDLELLSLKENNISQKEISEILGRTIISCNCRYARLKKGLL